jgi:hypothetical protein
MNPFYKECRIPDILVASNNLANTYSELGDHRKAQKLRKKELALRRKVSENDHANNVIAALKKICDKKQ